MHVLYLILEEFFVRDRQLLLEESCLVSHLPSFLELALIHYQCSTPVTSHIVSSLALETKLKS